MADVLGNGNGNGSKLPGALNEWLKIIVFLVGLGICYGKISDQLSAHTGQISDMSEQVKEMRQENKVRNKDVQKKLGSIDMYLCSKDPGHCNTHPPDDPDQ